jgi:hypothetical protein
MIVGRDDGARTSRLLLAFFFLQQQQEEARSTPSKKRRLLALFKQSPDASEYRILHAPNHQIGILTSILLWKNKVL